jgi:exopolyphosphatase/guanosine-5'-triphosphate,3'-diphosphate pyrophosphatase
MRVAAADTGTNSTRLLVADVGSDGSVAEVERLLEITRLGEGVDAAGTLGEVPMRRVTDALGRYAERARALGAESMLAVATSAARDASNGDDFLACVAATGFEPRLLSGEEEAAATFAGVCSHAPGEEPLSLDGALVVDVGGGSTELVLGSGGGVAWSCSLQAGCVRMTERILGEGVAGVEVLAACADAVSELLQVVPDEVVEAARQVVLVAGTATTAAAIEHGSYDRDAVHGARITRAQLRAQERHLAAMTLAERREVPGLLPARAPVIVAGLVIVGAVLDRFGIAEALVSERDNLHGTALLAARARRA